MLWNRWEPCVEVFEAEGRLERDSAPATPLGTFVEQEVSIPDEPIETEQIETGRLTTWDRVDALCGLAEIGAAEAPTIAR
jgi:hypothetical protein